MNCSVHDLEILKNFVKKVERGEFMGIVAINECKIVKEEKYGNVNVLLLNGGSDDLLFLCENLMRFLRERMKDTPKDSASKKLPPSSKNSLNYIG
jgi:hypothetical protein